MNRFNLARCCRCRRVLIMNTFLCADCCHHIERRIKYAILGIIALGAGVATWGVWRMYR